jgi:hypothetical protein
MVYARRLLDTYPRRVALEADIVAAAIEALNNCAQACSTDIDANLSAPDLPDMVTCIRLCLNCADVCTATARVASRPAEWEDDVIRPLLKACVASCKACGDECEHHGHMHEHCRVCAEACRRCEQACQDLLAALK